MKRTLVLMMVSLILLACGEKSNAVTAKEQSRLRGSALFPRQAALRDLSLHRAEHERTIGSQVHPADEGGQSSLSRDRHFEEGERPDSGEVRSYLVVVIPCPAQEWQGEG